MKQLTLEEAASWINCGAAGYYSHNSQNPIAHASFMCVFAQGDWWLVEQGALQLVDRGIEILPGGRWMRAVTLTVEDGHPIVALLQKDFAENAGPDLPVPVSVIVDNLPEPRRRERRR